MPFEDLTERKEARDSSASSDPFKMSDTSSDPIKSPDMSMRDISSDLTRMAGMSPDPTRMSDMSSKDVINMPALGRQFFLGTLYDCRTDTIIEGVTFWDEKDLEKKRVKPLVNFKSTTTTEDSLKDKTDFLEVNANLKLSFYGGLVDVKGSGNYLNDRVNSKKQARVTLCCTCTVRSESMTMDDHLGSGKIKHQDVFDHDLATHVVTGVIYGGQAFFMFDSENLTDETKWKVSGQLKAIIKKIPSVEIDGFGKVVVKDNEKNVVEKFNCTYCGDYIPEENPTTFADAMKLYKELSGIFKNNADNAKPVHVTLHPIALLIKKPHKIVREISMNLVSEVERTLEQFHEFEVQCNDLMSYDMVRNFKEYRAKIQTFKSHVVTYRLDFQKKLSQILPGIRGNGKEECTLVDLLKSRETSPFSQHALERWLENITCDVKILSQYTTMLSDAHIASGPGEFYAIYMDPQVRHVLAFSLQVPISDDHVNTMSEYLRYRVEDTYDAAKAIPVKKEVSYNLMEKARIFRDFLLENKGTPHTACAVRIVSCDTLAYDVKTEYYKDGCVLNENYEIPTCPEKIWPVCEEITHSSILINWNSPSHGMKNVTKYKISCSKVEQNSDPLICELSSTCNSHSFSDLEPGCEYKIQVQSLCELGISNKSSVTVRTRPTSPPGRPFAFPVSSDVIEIEWPVPRIIGNECSIEKYVVKMQQGESDWTKTKFVSLGDCRVSVTVLPSDTYRFKVYCVCGTAGVSLDSEDSNGVTMYPEEILKRKLQKDAKILRSANPCIIKPKETGGSYDLSNNLKKLEYGVKKADVPEKVVIAVGLKGSGKTTFVNGLSNKVYSVNWNDNFRLKMISEEGDQDLSQSCTKMVTSCTFHFDEGFSVPFTLTVIDTPGFDEGDVTQSDRDVMTQIHAFLRANGFGGISHLNAICLVVPSSLPSSLSVSAKKCGFSKILSLFGEEMADNVYVAITSADESEPQVLTDMKEANICYKKFFKFNNASLYGCKTQVSKAKQNEWSQECSVSNLSQWNQSAKAYELLLKEINGVRNKCIGQTRNVLLAHSLFQQRLCDLWKTIHISPTIFSQLMKTVEEAISQLDKGVVKEARLMDKPVVRKVDLPEGQKVLNCLTCNFTCVQYSCTLGASVPMKTEFCLFCPGKCHRDAHVLSPYKFEVEWSKTGKTTNDPSVRNKFLENLVKDAEKEFIAHIRTVEKKLIDTKTSHEQLNEIALRSVPFSGLEHINSSIAHSSEAYKAYSILVKSHNICDPERVPCYTYSKQSFIQ